MKIKLNNKRTEIKPCSLMTVAEYIETYNRRSEKGILQLIDYLSIVTDLKFAEVGKCNISAKNERQINAYIGDIIPFEHFYNAKEVISYFNFKRPYPSKEFDIEAYAVRSYLQVQTSTNNIDLAVHTLSILLSAEVGYDYGKTKDIYNELLQMNYIDIMKFAGFFLRKYRNISNGGMSFFKKLLTRLKVNIVRLLSPKLERY